MESTEPENGHQAYDMSLFDDMSEGTPYYLSPLTQGQLAAYGPSTVNLFEPIQPDVENHYSASRPVHLHALAVNDFNTQILPDVFTSSDLMARLEGELVPNTNVWSSSDSQEVATTNFVNIGNLPTNHSQFTFNDALTSQYQVAFDNAFQDHVTFQDPLVGRDQVGFQDALNYPTQDTVHNCSTGQVQFTFDGAWNCQAQDTVHDLSTNQDRLTFDDELTYQAQDAVCDPQPNNTQVVESPEWGPSTSLSLAEDAEEPDQDTASQTQVRGTKTWKRLVANWNKRELYSEKNLVSKIGNRQMMSFLERQGINVKRDFPKAHMIYQVVHMTRGKALAKKCRELHSGLIARAMATHERQHADDE